MNIKYDLIHRTYDPVILHEPLIRNARYNHIFKVEIYFLVHVTVSSPLCLYGYMFGQYSFSLCLTWLAVSSFNIKETFAWTRIGYHFCENLVQQMILWVELVFVFTRQAWGLCNREYWLHLLLPAMKTLSSYSPFQLNQTESNTHKSATVQFAMRNRIT